uniref:Secreted protein n=1 Tax=Panagrellus redivivus TaxID=6233 RepID=A0A7E4VN00_PANRE
MQLYVLHSLIVAIMCAKVIMPLGVSTIFKCAKVEVHSDAVPCHGRCDGSVVKSGCPILVSIIGGPEQQHGTLKVNLNFSEAKARLNRCSELRIWLPSDVKSIQLTVVPVVVGEEPDGTRSMSSNAKAFTREVLILVETDLGGTKNLDST